MKTLIRGLAATALALSLCVVGAAPALAGVLPGPVVDTKWLSANLDKVQVVDVRGNVKSFVAQPEFDTDAKTGKKTLSEVGGHIAGSRLIDMKTMRTDRAYGELTVKYMIPERAVFEKAVQAAGVDAGKPIVLVPMGIEVADVNDALRVYWQLKVYGEDNVAVLDGGMASWLIEGRAHVTDAAAARTGTWVSAADRSARYFASSDDVAKAIAKKDATLVDSRDARQYHGLGKRDYVGAYGHLEGAKLYPTDLLLKTAGGAVTFMSPATYRGLLGAQGIDPNAPAITYCNSGHLSSGPWFLMSELLGNSQARLYDGSLHQWTLEKRPLVGAMPLN
jgi:thiosulfate/3-mercaptopyruvate sulfurtransferase